MTEGVTKIEVRLYYVQSNLDFSTPDFSYTLDFSYTTLGSEACY